MKNALILACMTVLAVGFSACGGSEEDDEVKRCKALCEEQADCPDAPVTADNCNSVCASNAATSKTSGCTSEYDALLACTEGLDDKCQTTDQCGPGSGTDWSLCVSRYCQTHTTASVCASGS